jgi:ASC-1-like (ASCH) protein
LTYTFLLREIVGRCMHHVAIMRANLGLISKILSGEKRIESRWYATRRSPWNAVRAGDTVWFKNAGQPVTAKAIVSRVEQYESAASAQLILRRNGGTGGIALSHAARADTSWLSKKRYCILMWLKQPRAVVPFSVRKDGFGNACAWMTVEHVDKISVP